MKRLGLLALLVANSSAHALNPVQGLYGGIILGLNYTPNTSFVFPTTFVVPPHIPITKFPSNVIPANVDVSLDYGHLGQIGGQTGYRCGNYRIEAQLAYNYSPYSSLKINKVTLFAPSTSPYYKFKGATGTVSGMINGYYDLMPTDPQSNFAPFVGLGVGYAYTQNTIDMEFWYNKNPETGATVPGYKVTNLNINETTTSLAGQAMIGASYFLDDLTAFSLDLRYFTTEKKSQVLNARVQVLTVNLTFNGAFNLG